MTRKILMAGLAAAVLAGTVMPAQAQMGKMGEKRMQHRFEEIDADGDGRITQEEMAGHMQARFEGADSDGDGQLSRDEILARMQQRQAERMARMADHMLERHDANGDGLLSPDEMRAPAKGGMFERMDADGDGAISKEEFASMRERHGKHHGSKDATKAAD